MGMTCTLHRASGAEIQRLVENPDALADLPDPDRLLDIDKAWHGLHFLLTGTAEQGDEPGCFLMRGGQPLDDEGSVRAFGPGDVARLSRFLGTLSREELADRFDAGRMSELEIYPDHLWGLDAQGDDAPEEWLLDSFQDVKDFVARAAAAGDGLIIDIS